MGLAPERSKGVGEVELGGGGGSGGDGEKCVGGFGGEEVRERESA